MRSYLFVFIWCGCVFYGFLFLFFVIYNLIVFLLFCLIFFEFLSWFDWSVVFLRYFLVVVKVRFFLYGVVVFFRDISFCRILWFFLICEENLFWDEWFRWVLFFFKLWGLLGRLNLFYMMRFNGVEYLIVLYIILVCGFLLYSFFWLYIYVLDEV